MENTRKQISDALMKVIINEFEVKSKENSMYDDLRTAIELSLETIENISKIDFDLSINKKEDFLDDYTTFLFAEGYLTTLDIEAITEGKAIQNFLKQYPNFKWKNIK